MTEREERVQTSVVFEGQVADTDKELLSSLMGRLGLKFSFEENLLPSSAELALDQQAELIAEHGYKFSDITSPHHILLKEHFDDLVTDSPEYSKNTYTRAFSKMFDAGGARDLLVRWEPGQGYKQVREPKPLAGIIVVPRDVERLGQYTGSGSYKYTYCIANGYGIRAGSVVEALGDSLDQPRRKSAPEADKCIQDIADWLRFQFVTSNNLDY